MSRLERNLQIVCDNQAREIHSLRKALEGTQRQATRWQDAWEDLLGRVSDTYHRAKERPKGRKFVTVLEMAALISSRDDCHGAS